MAQKIWRGREITAAYFRRYTDNGQTKAYVEWSDGSRTEGDPLNDHMRTLMLRATTLGKFTGMQVW